MPKIGATIYETVSGMFRRVPNLTYAYVKQEMVRFGNRFRRRMRTERMVGRPGINAPFLAKGKQLSAWTKGDSIRNLVTSARVSRILKVHETGATITAKNGGYLAIRTGRSRGNFGSGKTGKVVARVQSVVIPARLGFRAKWREMVPDGRARIDSAVQRALKVSTERNVKQIIKIGS